MSNMTPREIVHELDNHIVGQNDAKRAVAIALRNRWRRIKLTLRLRWRKNRPVRTGRNHTSPDPKEIGMHGKKISIKNIQIKRRRRRNVAAHPHCAVPGGPRAHRVGEPRRMTVFRFLETRARMRAVAVAAAGRADKRRPAIFLPRRRARKGRVPPRVVRFFFRVQGL